MITTITVIAAFVILVHALVWILYRSVMVLSRLEQEKKLKPWQVTVGKCYVFLCLLVDVAANIIATPFIFGELAQEWTISQRLQRWVKSPDCRNRKLAIWFSQKLLNPYSVGGPHIKIPA